VLCFVENREKGELLWEFAGISRCPWNWDFSFRLVNW